jgi:lysophospholipase L1-like esterase
MDRTALGRGGSPPIDGLRRSAVVVAVVVFVVAVVAAVGGARPPSAASASTPSTPSSPSDPPVRYDLALGDSLAAGVGATAPADSYAALIERDQQAYIPGLQLMDLGCSGATTASFIAGGGCTYSAGSQLAAAESFLRTNGRRVAFVTIDIGINDIDGCMSTTSVDPACVADGLRQTSSGLTRILAGLRSADPRVAIYGADYYDPFLAAWFDGPVGQTVARQSEADVLALDDVLSGAYAAARIPVAQVAARFDTVGFASEGLGAGAVPANVGRICAWTWMCLGPNLHPNDAGHAQVAAAFDQVIRSTRKDRRSTSPAAATATATATATG